MLKKVLTALVASFLFATTTPAEAGGCTVYWTEFSSQADYSVYITEFSGQEKNASLIKGCSVVKYRSGVTYELYLTDMSSQADIIISANNVPKP
jgi:hypothetical protein